MLWLLIRYSVSPSDSTTGTGTADREEKPISGAGIKSFRVEGIQCNWLAIKKLVVFTWVSEGPVSVLWWQVDYAPEMVVKFSSVQFSCSVVSDSLRPPVSQHARPPCPSPTPGVHSDSHQSSQWCHPAISSSVVPFSCPQSLPFFAANDGEALYSQQKQDQELTVAQTMNSLPNSDLNWRK